MTFMDNGVLTADVTAAPQRRIGILGSAPSSIKLAPFGDPSWELWGCSPGCSQHLKPEQVKAWFEIHKWDPTRCDFDPEYIAFMKAVKGPVWTIEAVPNLPNSLPYPLSEMEAEFGKDEDLFTSTPSYMLALAISENPAEIGLWGIDMAASSEYFTQKPACRRLLKMARDRGIKITVPPQSDLLEPLPLYGFSEATRMGVKLDARHAEVTARIAKMRNDHAFHVNKANAIQMEIRFFEGALDDLQYIRNTWVQGAPNADQ